MIDTCRTKLPVKVSRDEGTDGAVVVGSSVLVES